MRTEAGERLRYADLAHTRLLMGADAGHLLSRTGHGELHSIADQRATLGVPQIAEALRELAARDRATAVH